jgi:hypothetical protein
MSDHFYYNMINHLKQGALLEEHLLSPEEGKNDE